MRADPVADVRAFPGGHLLISDGLVTRTGMKDDEVAGVVAFAIARLLLGHDVARLAVGADAATRAPDPNRQVLAPIQDWLRRDSAVMVGGYIFFETANDVNADRFTGILRQLATLVDKNGKVVGDLALLTRPAPGAAQPATRNLLDASR